MAEVLLLHHAQGLTPGMHDPEATRLLMQRIKDFLARV